MNTANEVFFKKKGCLPIKGTDYTISAVNSSETLTITFNPPLKKDLLFYIQNGSYQEDDSNGVKMPIFSIGKIEKKGYLIESTDNRKTFSISVNDLEKYSNLNPIPNEIWIETQKDKMSLKSNCNVNENPETPRGTVVEVAEA